jgi:hypothetical protein
MKAIQISVVRALFRSGRIRQKDFWNPSVVRKSGDLSPNPAPPPKETTVNGVNIRITRWGATAEQKAALVRGATQLLVDVLKEKAQD